jgi:hypothetical protein
MAVAAAGLQRRLKLPLSVVHALHVNAVARPAAVAVRKLRPVAYRPARHGGRGPVGAARPRRPARRPRRGSERADGADAELVGGAHAPLVAGDRQVVAARPGQRLPDVLYLVETAIDQYGAGVITACCDRSRAGDPADLHGRRTTEATTIGACGRAIPEPRAGSPAVDLGRAQERTDVVFASCDCGCVRDAADLHRRRTTGASTVSVWAGGGAVSELSIDVRAPALHTAGGQQRARLVAMSADIGCVRDAVDLHRRRTTGASTVWAGGGAVSELAIDVRADPVRPSRARDRFVLGTVEARNALAS